MSTDEELRDIQRRMASLIRRDGAPHISGERVEDTHEDAHENAAMLSDVMHALSENRRAVAVVLEDISCGRVEDAREHAATLSESYAAIAKLL